MSLLRNRFVSAAVLLAAAVVLTCWVMFSLHPTSRELAMFLIKYGTCLPLGTVTLSYFFFQAGIFQNNGTVPPTAAQALNENMLNVQLNWADTDTTATITHNWNLPASDQTADLPLMNILPLAGNTGSAVVLVSAFGTNTVTLGKTAVVGSTGTYVVQMERPHTLIK